MRRTLSTFPAISIGRASSTTTTTTTSFLSSFSTSSSDGRGRGRGRGIPVDFSKLPGGGGVTPPDQPPPPPPPQTSFSQGRGGGATTPPPPYPPSSGRGRGGVAPPPPYSGGDRGGFVPPLTYSGSSRDGVVPPPNYSGNSRGGIVPPPLYSGSSRVGVAPPPYASSGRGGGLPPQSSSQGAFAPRSGVDSASSGRGNIGVSSVPPYSGNGQGGRVSPPAPGSTGRGRGGISYPPSQSHGAGFNPRSGIDSEGVSSAGRPLRKSMMFVDEEGLSEKPVMEAKLQSGILPVLSGAGRGTPIRRSPLVSEAVGVEDSKPKQENRHIRKQVRGDVGRGEGVRGESGRGEGVKVDASPKGPKLSRAEAVEKAKGILTKGDCGGVGRAGGRGMGMVGRGRGRGRGGRGRGRGDRFEDDRDDDDDYEANEVQDKANEELLAKRLGPEMMNTVVEAFEDIADRVLPSPVDDAYVNALHTNLMIECEPEYMMGEFDQNPDIDEKPPMPLRDFLEKVKPFIMSYEGIQSQEEWEEAIKETMETVPLMKEIVDYYSGPDRVTAKTQQEELERVAKTLPASAPSSVKRFTDRAVLSLQSNPGWGFDKKCQFMDKLVREASQQYK